MFCPGGILSMGIDWAPNEWVHVLAIFGSSLATAVLAVLLLAIFDKRDRPRAGGIFLDQAEGTTFLFDGRDLVDATGAGRSLLAAAPEGEDGWTRLISYVAPRFPDFEEKIARLPELGHFSLISESSRPLTLCADWRGGLSRLTLIDPRNDTSENALDPISQNALEEELAGLRATMDHAPFLVWRETARGAVIWANRKYLTLASARDGEDLGWPLPRLFPELDLPDVTGNVAPARRASVVTPGGDTPLWYDCHALTTETGRLIFALPADAAVQAESSLRGFIQTLTKTFAHLPIGLAIFDRDRQLALFNPALIDLTGLSPEFLSARPTLPGFLDAMRERRTIPEPKDYKSWRTQMAALERAAASGQYEETWTLPSGLTYRVTGRPHPDGAVAFLFEDISAEMSLTRRFRAELELGQAVIDGMEGAIAVFSPAGELIVSNAAYGQLWQTEDAETPASVSFRSALGLWQSRCAPTPIWARLRQFAGSMEARESWSAEARLSDGRLLSCRFSPLAGGSTLVYFLALTAQAQQIGGTDPAPADGPTDTAAGSKRERRA